MMILISLTLFWLSVGQKSNLYWPIRTKVWRFIPEGDSQVFLCPALVVWRVHIFLGWNALSFEKKRNQLQFTLVTRQNPGNLEKSACLQISRPVNPLTPRSDWHVTSPYSIYTLSINEVVRLTWLIRYKILSWLNTKFSQPIYKEICSSWWGDLTVRSWELKGSVSENRKCLFSLDLHTALSNL